MLSLTDTQMTALQSAAELISSEKQRSVFIKAVAAKLTEPPRFYAPSDEAVRQAIMGMLNHLGIACGAERLGHQQRPKIRSHHA
jgi:hypothetical protein